MVYLNNQNKRVMLSVVTLAVLTAAWSWWWQWSLLWFVSVLVGILSLTIYDSIETTNSLFLTNAYATMKATECCALSEHLKYPKYVLRTTVALRSLCGLTAALAICITWSSRQDFSTGHYQTVSGSWVGVCLLWLVSCIPRIVSLLQCAAVSDQPIIIQYRKTISMWIIHDVFLGFFWMYLAVMLYDLSDDNNDSEWRTIFLSMISWHIIIIVLQEIYMKRQATGVTCCGPGNIQVWWHFFLLVAFVGMYTAIVSRMQDNKLTLLGMDTGYYVLFCVCTCLAYVCKSHIQTTVPIHRPTTRRNNVQQMGELLSF